MILATGGDACGEISTRSSPASSAAFRASARDSIPSCSPEVPITRSSEARIASLMRMDRLLISSPLKRLNRVFYISIRQTIVTDVACKINQYLLYFVSRPILQGFSHVAGGDSIGLLQISNRAGNADDLEITSG